MNSMVRCVILLMSLLSVSSAAIFVLDFENIAPYPNNSDVFVEDFYNGGTSSIGTTGPDYGITFDAPSLIICLNTLDTFCSNTSKGGLGDPDSQLSALFFLTSSDITMNILDGFDTGFSFNYTAVNTPGSVSVYSGLNGTGDLLSTLALPLTQSGPCPGYAAGFCPFFPVGVEFDGIAQSVVFAGAGNQIVFDDITFGSDIPGGGGEIPEPGTFGLLGLALCGLVLRSRRGAAAVSAAMRLAACRRSS